MGLIDEIRAAKAKAEGAPQVNPPEAEAQAIEDAPALDEKVNAKPAPVAEPPVEKKPKRKRRTKAEMAADKVKDEPETVAQTAATVEGDYYTIKVQVPKAMLDSLARKS